MYPFLYALVAQLDRVLDSDSKGRWFESSRAYHVGTDFAPFRFFISIKNQSHAPSFLLFAKDHVCTGYSLASALITPLAHYQPFAIKRLRREVFLRTEDPRRNKVGFVSF